MVGMRVGFTYSLKPFDEGGQWIMRRSFRLGLLFFLFLFLWSAGSAQAFSLFKDESAYKEGLKLWKSKQYEQSALSLQKAVKIDPDSLPAKKLLGWNYIKLGRLAEAETLFKAAQKEKSNDVGAIQGLAWVYSELGRNDEAVNLFNKEAAWAKQNIDHPDWFYYQYEDQVYIRAIYSDANFGLSNAAKTAGDYPKAIKHLETALKYPNDFTEKSELLTALADLQYAQKQYPAAVASYEEAVKADPKALVIRLKMGWCQYSAGQYGAAEQTFEKALALKQESVDNYYGLALSQAMQNKFDKARENLVKAIALYPYYADTPLVRELIGKQQGWNSLWKDFGLAYTRFGNYPAALYKLDGYLKTVNGQDYEALMAAGWSYRWLGSIDTALSMFRDAAKFKPTSDEPQVGIASALLADGQLAEAEKAFGEALSLNVGSSAAYNGLAYLYTAQKNGVKTEEALKKSLALRKDYFDSQAFLANLYFGQKRYAEAAAEYQKLTGLNKSVAASWNGLGWSAYNLGQYANAVSAFSESKKINPYWADAHYGLGMAYAKKGDLAQAKDAFVAAIEIYPYYAHTQDLLGLIKANSDWADLYASLGWSYYYTQQYEPALNAFREYLKIKPADRNAARGIAWSNYWLGHLDTAYTNFQDLLQKDSGDADALVGTGWVLFYKGKDDEALAALTKATAKNPELTNAWRTVAAIQFRKKNFKEADAVYKKIAALEPRALDVHYSEAWTLYREQKYREAIDKFNKSLSLYRYYGEPHYGLALCHLRLGDIDKARESFTTAIYLYPAYMDGQELYDILDGNSKLKDLYNALGWSYYYQYFYAAAKSHFDRMLKSYPGNRDALLGSGTVAYVLGDVKDAAGYYGQLLPGLPATADAWDKWSYMLDNLGWSYYALKDYDKAAETFRRLESYHPQTPYIAPMNGQGWCALQKGDKAGAEKRFRESLKIVPGNYGAEAGMKALHQ